MSYCINDQSSLNHLYAYTDYGGLAKELIQRLKFGNTPVAAKHIARFLGLIELKNNDLLVPVRTSPQRYRQRGYDQTILIAKQLSKQISLPLEDVLVRASGARQLGSGRHQRLMQLQGKYYVRRHDRLKGATILLLDDVRTTGATLEVAAKALLDAGAKTVNGLVFAQA